MFYSEALNGILLYSPQDELYAPWKQTDSKSTTGFWKKKIHSTSKDGSSTFTGLVIFEIGSSITGVSKMMRRMSLVSTIEYLIRHGIHVCKFTKNHVSMPSPEWAWNRLALPIPPRTSAGGQGAACVCEFAEITGKDGLYMNLRFIMDCSPPTQLLKTHHGLLTPKARNHSVQRQQRKKTHISRGELVRAFLLECLVLLITELSEIFLTGLLKQHWSSVVEVTVL